MEYKIILSIQAQELFTAIKDRREQGVVLARLEKLKFEPDKQGKALSEELWGYRSVRAVGQRYRIIYRVEEEQVVVVVVGIGRRKEGDKKDVYAITQQMVSELSTDVVEE